MGTVLKAIRAMAETLAADEADGGGGHAWRAVALLLVDAEQRLALDGSLAREALASKFDELAKQAEIGRQYARATGNADHQLCAKTEARTYAHAAALVRAQPPTVEF